MSMGFESSPNNVGKGPYDQRNDSPQQAACHREATMFELPKPQTVEVLPFQALRAIKEVKTNGKSPTFGEANAIKILHGYFSFVQALLDHFQDPFPMVEGCIAWLKSLTRRRNVCVSDIRQNYGFPICRVLDDTCSQLVR